MLLGWMACGLELTTITVEEESETVVPGASVLEQALGDLGFDAWTDMDLVDQQELANQGVEEGDITEVYVAEVVLEAIDPPGADLSFLSSLSLFVEAPGLARVRVASGTSFREGQPTVSLEVDEVDLAAYAVSRSMTFTAEVSGRRPDDATTVRASTAIEVGVTTRGAVSAARGD